MYEKVRTSDLRARARANYKFVRERGESCGLGAHTELPRYLATDTSMLRTLFVNTWQQNDISNTSLAVEH